MPCAHVIEHAKTSQSLDPGIQALAQVPATHPEEGVHKVFKDFQCSLDVPLSYTTLPTGDELPYIRMTDWLRYLARNDKLEYLTGEKSKMNRQAMLLEFWDRYSDLNPTHPIYEEALQGRINLHEAIPVLHHGDEGRGFKRSGVLIVSTHGLVGRGSHKGVVNSRLGKLSPDDPLCLNMIGHSLTRQFVQFVMPAAMYKDNSENFHHVLDLYAKEMRNLFFEGVSYGAEKVHLVCLNIKGDNVYLAKAGNMLRCFTRGPKSASSKVKAPGICWLCLAGKEDHVVSVPYEDLSLNPAWAKTCNAIPAWTEPGNLLQIPHSPDLDSEFYQVDLFHAFHLGCGKYFFSSAIAMLLQSDRIDGSSLPTKLATLTADLKDFCRRKHESPFISGFTVDNLHLKSSKETPNAGWSKAHTTSVVMKWFEDYLKRKFRDDDCEVAQLVATWLHNLCEYSFPFGRFCHGPINIR